jgi:hypothetical protein
MSNELTPLQLIERLYNQIEQVEAERDEAAALLREVVDKESITDLWCLHCGGVWKQEGVDYHFPTCLISRARAWLAKQEAKL